MASEVALALLFILILCTVGSAVILWPILLFRTFQHVTVGSPDDVRNTLLAVAALIGVPFLIWRTLIAAKQTNISREGHYTALFTKAVEQLGADKVVKRRDFKEHYDRDADGNALKRADGSVIAKESETGEIVGEYVSYEVTTTNYEVRLGAIYALERIAQDSDRDAWPIYLTLCAYVQNNAQPSSNSTKKRGLNGRNNSDLEQIFKVLDRYSGERSIDDSVRFEGIHLPSLRFESGNFTHAAFSNCMIEAINIRTGVGWVSFHNCNSSAFDARQAVLDGILLRDGEFGELVVNDCHWEPAEIVTKSDRAMLLGSNFRTGKIDVDTKQFVVSESVFHNIKFGSDRAYASKPWSVRRSVFNNCSFVEVNFTRVDLGDCQFNSCKFVRCSFVGSKGLDKDGNNFIDCFTDEDYQPGARSQYPEIDLEAQWSNWRHARGVEG